MGNQTCDANSFCENEVYVKAVRKQLDVLKSMLATPGFGEGELSLGAELETNIINAKGDAQHINQRLLDNCADSRLTQELNRYNLELNLSPVPATGSPFSTIGDEISSTMAMVNGVASKENASLVAIGILPTLQKHDLVKEAISDNTRYEIFANKLLAQRGGKFKLQINGDDPFSTETDTIAYEGAGTSFQLHIRVTPSRFAAIYNTIQLVTPVVVAFAANSPSLLGHLLWDETRIALFKQSIDTRRERKNWRLPPRVIYGSGWNRKGLYELFAANVGLYEPLLPQLFDQDAAAAWQNGIVPTLEELKLHQGTVWSWNRGIYDHQNNGHVRVEVRSLPAGPTVADMMANSAVLTGLAYGLEDEIEDLIAYLPFKYAGYNFYRAAQSGVNAQLIWPHPKKHSLIEMSPKQIIKGLIPYAKRGLEKLNVAQSEIQKHIGIFEERVEANTSAAQWQRTMIKQYEQTETRHDAMHLMFDKYRHYQQQNTPVSNWNCSK